MTAMTRLTILLFIAALDTWKENVGNVAVKIAKGKLGLPCFCVSKDLLDCDLTVSFSDFFAGKPLPSPESLNQYAKDMLVAQRDLE